MSEKQVRGAIRTGVGEKYRRFGVARFGSLRPAASRRVRQTNAWEGDCIAFDGKGKIMYYTDSILPSIQHFSGVRRFVQSDSTIKSKMPPASGNLIGSAKLVRSHVLSTCDIQSSQFDLGVFNHFKCLPLFIHYGQYVNS